MLESKVFELHPHSRDVEEILPWNNTSVLYPGKTPTGTHKDIRADAEIEHALANDKHLAFSISAGSAEAALDYRQNADDVPENFHVIHVKQGAPELRTTRSPAANRDKIELFVDLNKYQTLDELRKAFMYTAMSHDVLPYLSARGAKVLDPDAYTDFTNVNPDKAPHLYRFNPEDLYGADVVSVPCGTGELALSVINAVDQLPRNKQPEILLATPKGHPLEGSDFQDSIAKKLTTSYFVDQHDELFYLMQERGDIYVAPVQEQRIEQWHNYAQAQGMDVEPSAVVGLAAVDPVSYEGSFGVIPTTSTPRMLTQDAKVVAISTGKARPNYIRRINIAA